MYFLYLYSVSLSGSTTTFTAGAHRSPNQEFLSPESQVWTLHGKSFKTIIKMIFSTSTLSPMF